MKAPVVIIGIGELGGEFARGLLRCGYPVYPVTRAMDMAQQCRQAPSPCLVLIMVPENELHPVLEQLPAAWRSRVGLLQNELLPGDWQRHGLVDPTVTVVWFEKKKGQPLTNILYTPVFGPGAPVIAEALQALEIPVQILPDEDTLLFELVRKTVYILTVNIAGLITCGTVGELWHQHRKLAEQIAQEVIAVQAWLSGRELSGEKLIAGMAQGIEDCPHRSCVGRRALERLQRTLAYARDAGIDTPHMLEIYNTVTRS